MLNFTIYKKLSKLTMYTVRSQEVGKIINLLSNDFNTIETKAPIFFASVTSPLALPAAIAILIVRFGWPGIIIGLVILVMVPLQGCIGKING